LRWSGPGSAEVLPGSDADGQQASAISQDGRVIVGYSQSNGSSQPFRWQAGEVELLGASANATGHFAASGVDADGSTIVGTAVTGLWLWDRAHGIRGMATVLGGLGEDLSSWRLDLVSGVSADGRHIIGDGVCGNRSRGFLVRLPADSAELAP
jgi:probable HAF family extracellular repeat protein